MVLACCRGKGVENGEVEGVYGFLRVIADRNRLNILRILRDGPRCVCEIVSALGISDKLASHHLRRLKGAGLLTEERKGNFIHYGLDRDMIAKYSRMFNEVIT
jgi:ArsR family transcriptional regulator, arsenate/arsenite/antimonite-responsive transcriptional repressor